MNRLVARIRAGDLEAESEVLQHFTPRVYALLCARVRDRDTARDLLHDVLIALLRALRQGQVREPEKLAAFALGIARNTAQSFIREAGKRREALVTGEAPLTPLDLLENEERDRHISTALNRLDPLDREILRLTLVEGHKPGTICEMLQMSSDVVRQRKTRATRKTAEFLKNLLEVRSQTEF